VSGDFMMTSWRRAPPNSSGRRLLGEIHPDNAVATEEESPLKRKKFLRQSR
jgi:hypothetical protein